MFSIFIRCTKNAYQIPQEINCLSGTCFSRVSFSAHAIIQTEHKLFLRVLHGFLSPWGEILGVSGVMSSKRRSISIKMSALILYISLRRTILLNISPPKRIVPPIFKGCPLDTKFFVNQSIYSFIDILKWKSDVTQHQTA